ncbi:MAG: hypothetical protein HKN63_04175 [Rhodobacteraceae bacterium]|nr:hypothetical protein [Paracoccaceae bacterium]
MKPVLTSALLTGAFCAGFAVVIEQATDMLATGSVILFAALSGFLGSLFAQLVLRGRR